QSKTVWRPYLDAPIVTSGAPGTLRRDGGCLSKGVHSSAAPVALPVVLQHHEVIAQEARGLCPRMRNQGLGLGEFQLEVRAQEPADRLLDLLSLTAWATKPEQPIVRVPDIPQASVVWVVRIQGGQRLHLTTQAPSLVALSRFPPTPSLPL